VRLLVHWRDEDGMRLPVACWHPGPGYRMISSGVLGGGIGPREWVLNAQVPGRYARTDPAGHLTELAGWLGLTGPGTGMLTAAQITDLVTRTDEGVQAAVTAGLRVPTWAAAPAGGTDPELAPGTINVIVSVPVPFTDAALVNAVITATEAKTQAVLDAGFAGTGTATDAVCVAALASPGAAAEDFAGPRSAWGARIARAVHACVLAAATTYRAGPLAPLESRTHDDGQTRIAGKRGVPCSARAPQVHGASPCFVELRMPAGGAQPGLCAEPQPNVLGQPVRHEKRLMPVPRRERFGCRPLLAGASYYET
jgi:adenosylcobinamide amidohydrolase